MRKNAAQQADILLQADGNISPLGPFMTIRSNDALRLEANDTVYLFGGIIGRSHEPHNRPKQLIPLSHARITKRRIVSYLAQFLLTWDTGFAGRSQACLTQQADVFKDDSRADLAALADSILRQESDPHGSRSKYSWRPRQASLTPSRTAKWSTSSRIGDGDILRRGAGTLADRWPGSTTNPTGRRSSACFHEAQTETEGATP